MKIIVNNKKPKGICYRGSSYESGAAVPTIRHTGTTTIKAHPETSAGTAATTGYPVTYTFTTSSFNLYRLINKRAVQLNTLPTYKFRHISTSVTDIESLTLVYDGDGLFHITGDLSTITDYTTNKYGANTFIELVDETNMPFLTTTSGVLTSSIGSSTTVSFTTPTISWQKYELIYTEDEVIALPYSIVSYSSTFPTMLETRTDTIAIAYTVTHTIL